MKYLKEQLACPINAIKDNIESNVIYNERGKDSKLNQIRFTYINNDDIRMLISFIKKEANGRKKYYYIHIGKKNNRRNDFDAKNIIYNISTVVTGILDTIKKYKDCIIKAGKYMNKLSTAITDLVKANVIFNGRKNIFRFATVLPYFANDYDLVSLKFVQLNSNNDKINYFVKFRVIDNNTVLLENHVHDSNILNIDVLKCSIKDLLCGY